MTLILVLGIFGLLIGLVGYGIFRRDAPPPAPVVIPPPVPGQRIECLLTDADGFVRSRRTTVIRSEHPRTLYQHHGRDRIERFVFSHVDDQGRHIFRLEA